MLTEKIKDALVIIGVPVLAGLVIRFLFDIDSWSSLWNVMSLTFFAALPYIVGILTMYLSRMESVRRLSYRIFYPWIPIMVFFLVTMFFSIEGWACWLMVLPIFLFFASLGGVTAGYLRLRRSSRANNLHLSLAIVLPFLIGPVEKSIAEVPGFYEAYTFIDIRASREKIWDNVTRVSEIDPREDSGKLTTFLQIPRPIKAELDYEGVGARREAIFEGGLVFDERVSNYDHQKMMRFSIRANTYEIPSTTFDEHILIGGEFFDVLEGTYELEEIRRNEFRLHLYSEFKLKTSFNFYASVWGRWIMKDIQENILRIVKSRSELVGPLETI